MHHLQSPGDSKENTEEIKKTTSLLPRYRGAQGATPGPAAVPAVMLGLLWAAQAGCAGDGAGTGWERKLGLGPVLMETLASAPAGGDGL